MREWTKVGTKVELRQWFALSDVTCNDSGFKEDAVVSGERGYLSFLLVSSEIGGSHGSNRISKRFMFRSAAKLARGAKIERATTRGKRIREAEEF